MFACLLIHRATSLLFAVVVKKRRDSASARHGAAAAFAAAVMFDTAEKAPYGLAGRDYASVRCLPVIYSSNKPSSPPIANTVRPLHAGLNLWRNLPTSPIAFAYAPRNNATPARIAMHIIVHSFNHSLTAYRFMCSRL